MPSTLVPYTPEVGFTRLPDMIERLFRESFVAPTPFEFFFDGKRKSNLLETDNAYIAQLVLPGIDPEKIQIHVVGTQLTIKAFLNIPMVENATYLYRGLVNEEFSEVFTLPLEVVGEKAVAHYDSGILTISLPKTEYAKPKMITVKMPT